MSLRKRGKDKGLRVTARQGRNIKLRRREGRKEDHQDTTPRREETEWDTDEHRLTRIKILHRSESPLRKGAEGKAFVGGPLRARRESSYFLRGICASALKRILPQNKKLQSCITKADSTHHPKAKTEGGQLLLSCREKRPSMTSY